MALVEEGYKTRITVQAHSVILLFTSCLYFRIYKLPVGEHSEWQIITFLLIAKSLPIKIYAVHLLSFVAVMFTSHYDKSDQHYLPGLHKSSTAKVETRLYCGLLRETCVGYYR